MSPLQLLIPSVALLVGPQLWVLRIRRRHDAQEIDEAPSASELARALLDRHGLSSVGVECTDLADHYDPRSKSVRLSRYCHDRRSLTALVTAAHEVGHALQDATGYPPFRWRAGLARVARVTGGAGAATMIAVPLVSLATRRSMPPGLIGTTALVVLGTSIVAQLAALPTEWDASFKRAMPLLATDVLDERQLDGAREMLFACSLTYVTASLAGMLQLWPWLPRASNVSMISMSGLSAIVAPNEQPRSEPSRFEQSRSRSQPAPPTPRTAIARDTAIHGIVRRVGKPLIRAWLKHRDHEQARSHSPA